MGEVQTLMEGIHLPSFVGGGLAGAVLVLLIMVPMDLAKERRTRRRMQHLQRRIDMMSHPAGR